MPNDLIMTQSNNYLFYPKYLQLNCGRQDLDGIPVESYCLTGNLRSTKTPLNDFLW